MKLYTVGASNMNATYTAGKFVAESKDEAIRKARQDYRNSEVGRYLKDIGAFRFYIIDAENISR